MVARRFHMPGSAARRDNAPFYYGFDYGSAHFTVVSTEHDLSPGSPQHGWLERELAAVDRCKTPWLVLLLHRPMYVVLPHKTNREVGEHLKGSLEGLLDRYRVDLAISGHIHSYTRTCAVHGDRCVGGSGGGGGAGGGGGEAFTPQQQAAPKAAEAAAAAAAAAAAPAAAAPSASPHGTVHMIIGSAGHELSAVQPDQDQEWLAASLQVFGYSRFAVEGDKRMVVEFVESETGRILDSFELAPAAAPASGCSSRSGSGGGSSSDAG